MSEKGRSVESEAGIPSEWLYQRDVWARKRILRQVYEDLFIKIDRRLHSGTVLEIGSGIAAFKEDRPRVTALDIAYAPWLDIVGDAEHLPIDTGSFDNIVAIDVLHHVPKPLSFLEEAARILRGEGRLVLVEPAITMGSLFFYRYIHQERADMSVNPFDGEPTCSKDPYDANQTIPTLLFCKYPDRLRRVVPGLQLLSVEFCSVIAYPLSGGFKSWSLIPRFLVGPALAFENGCHGC